MQNGIPVGLRSSPSFGLSRSGQLTAIIQSLFWDGSQGWWYDDNDTTTLFQDSAGTTPVTAVEQFVGLQLDKSRGLVLGPELRGAGLISTIGTPSPLATYNTTTGAGTAFRQDGSNTSGVRIPVTDGRYYLVDVEQLTGTLQIRGTSPAGNILVASVVGRQVFRLLVSAGEDLFFVTGTNAASVTFTVHSVRELPGNHRYAPASGNRPIWSKRVNLYVGTTALATQNVTTQATSYVLRFSGTGSITLSGTATGSFNAGVHTVTCTAGTLTSTVSGTVTDADIRPANQATGTIPLYQRVNTSTDYDTNGFPGYLKADGVDDFLQTNSIDFTATDKITLCAGVRKLSDALTGVFAEISVQAALNNGAFLLTAPGQNGASSYRFHSRGTAEAIAGAGVFAAAPDTAVLTGIGNISGDVATIRRNGSVVDTVTTDQGTGNYGNYPAYFFRRAGTSNPFTGNEYGNIAVGKLLTADQLTALETYMNGLTRAY